MAISTKLRARFVDWVEKGAYDQDNIVYRSDRTDVVDHADITWPDGSTGKLVTTEFKVVDYVGLQTAFQLSHVASGTVITQRPVTLNTAGLLVHKPPLTFNDTGVPQTWADVFAGKSTWADVFAGKIDWYDVFGLPRPAGGFGVTPFGSTPFGA